MSYIVAQLGARMHYAVPRILHKDGELGHLYTDISASKGWLRLSGLVPDSLRSGGLRRLMGRMPSGIPGDRVTAFNLFGINYAYRCRQARSSSELTRVFLWGGQTFCRRVLKRGLGAAHGVYVFNSAGLEILERARIDGRRRVVEQTIAPRRIEQALMRDEQERFPDWQAPLEDDLGIGDYCDREEAEWGLADVIVCGSSFVKRGIVARGGPAARCKVIPYGIDGRYRMRPREGRSGLLRVLTVGGIGLRKGSPYVLAAARALRRVAQFRMVGALEASANVRAELSEAVELTGPVPRSDMRAHFAWADVFLLPSICEGSATAAYEALTASLPVVCTENTGSVIRDGIEGRIVPIRDVDSIVEALHGLASDADLRRQMAERAGQLSETYDLSAYGSRLQGVLGEGPVARDA